MVTATVLVFIASILGCADSGMDTSERMRGGQKAAGGGACFCSLVAWVLTLAAYCLWASIPYVQSIQSDPPAVQVPIWQTYPTTMNTLGVYDAYLGAGWATALTASILMMISWLIHCVSLRGDSDEPPQFNGGAKGGDGDMSSGAMNPPPAQAVPVRAQAVPVNQSVTTV